MKTMSNELQVEELTRPKTVNEFVGNRRAVDDVKAWAAHTRAQLRAKSNRVPVSPLVIVGSSGVGKTSLAYIAASLLDRYVQEVNTSDPRCLDALETTMRSASRSALSSPHFGTILFDDFDSAKTIKCSEISALNRKVPRCPIIMTCGCEFVLQSEKSVRDFLNKSATKVTLGYASVDDITKVIKNYCHLLKKGVDLNALKTIALQSAGDLRQALIMANLVSRSSAKEVSKAPVTNHRDIHDCKAGEMCSLFRLDPARNSVSDMKRKIEASCFALPGTEMERNANLILDNPEYRMHQLHNAAMTLALNTRTSYGPVVENLCNADVFMRTAASHEGACIAGFATANQSGKTAPPALIKSFNEFPPGLKHLGSLNAKNKKLRRLCHDLKLNPSTCVGDVEHIVDIIRANGPQYFSGFCADYDMQVDNIRFLASLVGPAAPPEVVETCCEVKMSLLKPEIINSKKRKIRN